MLFRYGSLKLHKDVVSSCYNQCFFLGKTLRNAFEIRECIITYIRCFDIKYTNKQSLGRKGVGRVFPRIPTEKSIGYNKCLDFIYLLVYFGIDIQLLLLVVIWNVLRSYLCKVLPAFLSLS